MKVIYTVGLIVVSFFRSGRKFEASRGKESSGVGLKFVSKQSG